MRRPFLFALFLVLVPSASVQADAPPMPGAHVYDVQAVMVLGKSPGVAELVPDWGGPVSAPLTTMAWNQRLLLLKQRGETTLLLDGRTTAVDGMPTELSRNWARFLRLFDRSDETNEYWKNSTVNEGVTVKLKAPSADFLEYEAQVNWSLPRQGEGAPLQGSWRMKGTVPMPDGKTLVLSHREQVPEEGQAPRDVELYVFVTPSVFGVE
jgi:hypothetical protein